MRLAEAARRAFPDGGMTEAGLRREAQRGRLAISRIAGKDFTTLADIDDMVMKCRNPQRESASGSVQAPQGSARRGLSETAQNTSAQAALQTSLSKLKRRSPSTSGPDTGQRAEVVTLRKSKSRTS